tara:strand:+ start:337 stop:699 length:363 start_codon:yes stop_codon:yes gene_type:complete
MEKNNEMGEFLRDQLNNLGIVKQKIAEPYNPNLRQQYWEVEYKTHQVTASAKFKLMEYGVYDQKYEEVSSAPEFKTIELHLEIHDEEYDDKEILNVPHILIEKADEDYWTEHHTGGWCYD